jgi:hypothetical protein
MVEDTVIFEHLFELSDGKLNLIQDGEELVTTTELIKINNKVSNKLLATPSKNMKIQSFKKNTNGKKPFVKKNNNQQ